MWTYSYHWHFSHGVMYANGKTGWGWFLILSVFIIAINIGPWTRLFRAVKKYRKYKAARRERLARQA